MSKREDLQAILDAGGPSYRLFYYPTEARNDPEPEPFMEFLVPRLYVERVVGNTVELAFAAVDDTVPRVSLMEVPRPLPKPEGVGPGILLRAERRDGWVIISSLTIDESRRAAIREWNDGLNEDARRVLGLPEQPVAT